MFWYAAGLKARATFEGQHVVEAIWLTSLLYSNQRPTKFHKVWHAFGETESPQLFDDIVT